ncbi:MAG: winged helix-turn-helix domain-containing protein [Desulfurococcaceae archaeon TW002]
MSPQLEEVFSSKARVKVLRVILGKGEVNINQIIKETKLNYKTVCKHIDYLVNAGLVEEVKIGKLRLVRPNWLNPKTRKLEELFNSF